MNRKETTKFLTDVLITNRLSDRKYYAKEVSVDYGTDHTKRVDVMEFAPLGVIHASDIEKGSFICYEVKSCKEDIYSGNGLNFLGEKNYLVTNMETYKKIKMDIIEGKLQKYVQEHYPESSRKFGIMVAVPAHIDLRDADAIYKEMENPTPLDGEPSKWKMYVIERAYDSGRNRSTTELLFCMLRSKHSYSNHN